MKTKTVILSALLTITLAAGIGLVTLQNNLTNAFWRNLHGKIRDGQTTIHLHEVTDFEWDKVCVLEGYVLEIGDRQKRIAEYIEGDLGSFRDKLPVQNSDGQWAFVFIWNGAVVEILERGRGYWVYRDYQDNCIDRSAAKFVVSGKDIKINDNIGWRK